MCPFFGFVLHSKARPSRRSCHTCCCDSVSLTLLDTYYDDTISFCWYRSVILDDCLYYHTILHLSIPTSNESICSSLATCIKQNISIANHQPAQLDAIVVRQYLHTVILQQAWHKYHNLIISHIQIHKVNSLVVEHLLRVREAWVRSRHHPALPVA